jgi:hypothetical protein
MIYGQKVPNIPYPVVNEREIRAAAGLMFLIGIITFCTVFFTRDYFLMHVVVPIFWLDFFLKSVFAPRFSIFGFLGGLMVRNQTSEYVGAIQKRFAWSLGLILATTMVIVAIFLEIHGWAPFAICATCLSFMWMETALGVCVGCQIYQWLLKKKIIPQPEHQPTCPGGVCSLKNLG